jgi:hypothetical protein
MTVSTSIDSLIDATDPSAKQHGKMEGWDENGSPATLETLITLPIRFSIEPTRKPVHESMYDL